MKKTGAFFADRLAIGVTVIGLVLMAVSLHYNVNPVCGGAVRGGIQNQPLILFPLALTTIPAMLLALILRGLVTKMSGWTLMYQPLVFVCQAVLAFACGKILSLVVRIRQHETRE